MFSATMPVVLAASDSGSDPVSWLTGLGIPGVIISLFLTGQLRTKSEVEFLISENKRKDELIEAKDEQIQKLIEGVGNRALTSLSRSASVLEAIPEQESAWVIQVQEAKREVAKLTERLERLGN